MSSAKDEERMKRKIGGNPAAAAFVNPFGTVGDNQTPSTSTKDISDSSNAQNSTVNADDSLVLDKSTKNDSHTSNEQINTTHGNGSNVVNKKTTNERDTNNEQIGSVQDSDTSNTQTSRTHVYDTKNVHIKGVHESAATEVLKSFKDSMKRETVEDTHTRKTFIVRNDLLRELDKLSKKQGRGFQTWFVNMAFERLIDDINGSQTKK